MTHSAGIPPKPEQALTENSFRQRTEWLAPTLESSAVAKQRRRQPRLQVQCCARIRIGNRQYAGYLHDISEAGARLRTITPIRRLGQVVLQLPDLPPIRCELRWTDAYHAGVAFSLILTRSDLSNWIETRGNIEVIQADIQEDLAA